MSKSAKWWPWMALFGVLAAASYCIIRSESLLPPVVVTKWVNGRAVSRMSRDQWIASALWLTTLVTLLTSALPSLLTRRWPRLLSVPNRRYWLAEPRRSAAMTLADRFNCATGAGACLWMTGFHWMIVQANQRVPPAFPGSWIALWMGAFAVGLGLLLSLVARAFRVPADS